LGSNLLVRSLFRILEGKFYQGSYFTNSEPQGIQNVKSIPCEVHFEVPDDRRPAYAYAIRSFQQLVDRPLATSESLRFIASEGEVLPRSQLLMVIAPIPTSLPNAVWEMSKSARKRTIFFGVLRLFVGRPDR